jgi:hypothetical protein
LQSEGLPEAFPLPKFRLLAALLAVLSAAGCLKETRRVEVTTPVVMKEASLEDLKAIIGRFAAVNSLKATVELQLTYLNDERTKENILRDVRGAIVAERPESIRVRAMIPVTHQTAFDMTSSGGTFRVFLTWKNRFFEGSTDVETRSAKRSENIRPQHILEPLLIERFDPQTILALDTVLEGRTAYYVVQEMVKDESGFRITRKFWFDRADLSLSRLELRDKKGELATQAQYAGWTDYGEKIFPTTATINRPVDGYTLKITFSKPGIDEPPTENAFDLQPPKGVEVERIEQVREAVTKKGGAA